MLNLIVLDSVTDFVSHLAPEDAGTIDASLMSLANGDTKKLIIKPLKGKILELSVRQYRIVYFRVGATIYAVDIFKKQSRKTPLRFIRQAEKRYRAIINIFS